MTIFYRVRDRLYVNLTNRCPCVCVFCIRQNGDTVYEETQPLWLAHEPDMREIEAAFTKQDLSGIVEIVFCGYGEPTEALDSLLQTARFLKEKCPLPLRLNTNGLSDLINGKPTAHLLAELFDTVSVSLNSSDKEIYLRTVRPKFGESAFEAMKNFAAACKKYVPHVVMTTVSGFITKADEAECAALCKSLGVTYRIREYASGEKRSQTQAASKSPSQAGAQSAVPFKLVSLGEILVDFTPAGNGFDAETGNPAFVQNPGGAPANVLACFSKLGGRAAFLGAVGRDAFGDFLRQKLEEAGVDASGIVRKDKAGTTLAFVNLSPSGERSFTFYRNPGADTCISAQDVPANAFEGCTVFHFGSLSLTDEPARGATFASIQNAKNAGALISFDPNWRPSLWASEADALRQMKAALAFADLLKVSEEEAFLITDESSRISAGRKLAESVPLVVMTLGAEGSVFFRKRSTATGAAREEWLVPAFSVRAADTTGAGDAFWGAFLFFLLERNFAHTPVCGAAYADAASVSAQSAVSQSPEEKRAALLDALSSIPDAELAALCSLANAAGGLCASRKGAIPAMPTRGEILQLAGT